MSTSFSVYSCSSRRLRRSIHKATASALIIGAIAGPAAFSQPAYVPTPSPLTPGVQNGTTSYSLQQEVNCPTATFHLTGFGGKINGWANNDYDPFQSSDGALGNYGAAAGLSVPLGNNELREFCKKYAKIKSDFEESRLKNQLLNNQVELLKQCLYLSDLGIRPDADPKAFSEGGPLSSFAGCQSLAILLDPYNRRPKQDLSPQPPPKASTEPMTKPATPVFIINQPTR